MEMTLTRTGRMEGYTTGVLYTGEELLGHTLEPIWRDLRTEPKVWGKTAIPEGTYRIVFSPSARFHRRMPCLLDVPGFTGILIHAGNTTSDTAGCILVGERSGCDRLKNSRQTFERLYDRLARAAQAGETLSITVM